MNNAGGATADVKNDLNMFSDWCSNHGLKIDPDKTVALCFGNQGCWDTSVRFYQNSLFKIKLRRPIR